MTIVFLSGSRKINRINDSIRQRIDNMVEKNLTIIVGDANGADKAMQSYLAEIKYPHVTVYFVGDNCRNNVGGWPTENVVPSDYQAGRDFYTLKDKKMAQNADFGFVLWDGKSAGSMANILELLRFGKKGVVYLGPERKFYTISNSASARQLIDRCASGFPPKSH